MLYKGTYVTLCLKGILRNGGNENGRIPAALSVKEMLREGGNENGRIPADLCLKGDTL